MLRATPFHATTSPYKTPPCPAIPASADNTSSATKIADRISDSPICTPEYNHKRHLKRLSVHRHKHFPVHSVLSRHIPSPMSPVDSVPARCIVPDPGIDRKISSESSFVTSCGTPATASFLAKLPVCQYCNHRLCTSRCGNSGRNPVAAVSRQEGRPVSWKDVLARTTVPAHTSATSGHTDLHSRPSRPFLQIFPSSAVAEW